MACDSNVDKGNSALLLLRDDLDTKWQIVGGIQSRDNTSDHPTETVTSSSSPHGYNENEYTGYSDDNMSISGVIDTREGTTRTVRDVEYEIAPSKRLDQVANTGEHCGKFKLIYSFKEKEGFYTVTSYGDSGDTPGLLNFTATMQNRNDIVQTYY